MAQTVFHPFDQTSTTAKAKALTSGIDHSAVKDLPLVVVVNYDSVWRDEVAELLKSINIDMLILDESHRVKSHNGKASKFCAEIAPNIPHRIGLTGTPMPHSPVDLFGQFRAIDVDLFGRYITPFRDRYTIKGGYQGREVVGFQNQDEMRDRFNILTYTVKTKDALPDLPDTLDVDIDIELEPKAKKLYKALEKDFISWLEEENEVVVVSNALGKLLRLQQMTSGYARTEDGGDIEISTAKIDALHDILIDHGDTKVVVFVRFKHDIAVVRKLCESMKLKCYELSGERHELTKDATIKDDCEVQITQVQSGSVGVDFSKASIAVDYSVDFSLGNWLQSRARLHRPGQVNKVVFYHLKCKGTVDMKIYRAFAQKQDVINMILEEGYGSD
jgi:SNF2 family DNA or RNA helicase